MSSARALAGLGFLAVVALLVWPGCTRRESATPGDVVLIVIDTQRADHLSVYGYERDTSPELRDFARQAVVYENAISPGTWTVPAHASLFTGRWPSYHGAERVKGAKNLATPIRAEVPTLAELLGKEGFYPIAFVANTAYVARPLGFGRGFAEFHDRGLNTAGEVVESALTTLRDRKDRVFLFMNVLDPHEPYAPPPPFDERFDGKHAELGTALTEHVNRGEQVTPAMRAHFVSQYDGEVAYTDHVLGQLFAELRRLGRYDDALIVVTSDHGELLGEHGMAGHGLAPFEPLVRVPLLVRFPGGRRAGERVTRRVSTLGVFATALAHARAAAPSGSQSRPLDEPHVVWVEDVAYDGLRVRVGYDGDEKLVTSSSEADTESWLYDLAEDPEETSPAKDGSGATRLRAAMDAFVAEPRPVLSTAPPVIDPEREWKLRQLGYLQ